MKKKAVKAMFEHAEIQLVPLQEQMAFLKTKKEKLLLPSGDEKEKSLAVNETALEFITEQVELIEKQVRNIQERYLISLEVLKQNLILSLFLVKPTIYIKRNMKEYSC